MQKLDKKSRERHYIDQFLGICNDFSGYTFAFYRENPDLVYSNTRDELGFDSIVIAEDQEAASCYFEEAMCTVHVPSDTLHNDLMSIRVFFTEKLTKHMRRYAIPTVLVFTILDEQVNLHELATQITIAAAPELNISAYYLVNSSSFLKL